MKMNSDLRNKIAADIFVNSVADMKSEALYNQVKEQADSEGKEVGTYLAECAIDSANGFMSVLEKKDGKRING